MTILIKLFYAGAITTLLILFVAFGIRTLYPGPTAPVYPGLPPGFKPMPVVVDSNTTPTLPPEQQQQQREYEEEQQRYQEEYKAYEDERATYHRNVFLAAALLGVLAVAGGVALKSHLDALRLGLVAGGLGTLIYAVIQAGGDLDNVGSAVVFAVAALGLLLVAGSGYRWLSNHEQAGA